MYCQLLKAGLEAAVFAWRKKGLCQACERSPPRILLNESEESEARLRSSAVQAQAGAAVQLSNLNVDASVYMRRHNTRLTVSTLVAITRVAATSME
jgi:hypothetical protein